MKIVHAFRRGYSSIAHWGFFEYAVAIVMIGVLCTGLADGLHRYGWKFVSLLAFPVAVALASTAAWRVIKSRRRVPLEQQLAVLATCGIALKRDKSLDLLLSSRSRRALEAEPYLLLLCAMGEECSAGSDVSADFCSDDIWHFDTECIEDHGDYARIADRMAVLAGGRLPLENVRDFVDVEAGIAWLSFSLGPEQYKWDFAVQDDWVDPSLFAKLVNLLDTRSRDERFISIDLKGQDCLIGCLTAEQMSALQSKTNLSVMWLE